MSEKQRSAQNQDFLDTGYLDGANADYLEQMQAKYMADPHSVDDSWRACFSTLGEDAGNAKANADGPSWERGDWPQDPKGDLTEALTGYALEADLTDKISKSAPSANNADVRQATKDSLRALMLIRAYRMRGHLIADLDPLGLMKRVPHPDLEPSTYGFTEADFDRSIFIDGVLGLKTATLREILAILARTYCSTFGVQYMHVSDPTEKSWLQDRIEGPDKEISFSPEGRKAILQKLIEAQAFEDILQRRYPGTKRFGLDGAESLI